MTFVRILERNIHRPSFTFFDLVCPGIQQMTSRIHTISKSANDEMSSIPLLDTWCLQPLPSLFAISWQPVLNGWERRSTRRGYLNIGCNTGKIVVESTLPRAGSNSQRQYWHGSDHCKWTVLTTRQQMSLLS